MENLGIINVWIEHYYFLTGTSEISFFGRNFVTRKKRNNNKKKKQRKKLREMLEKHP